ncbi:PrpF family protein [Rhodovulum sp. BSW8]|uniref:2-methylaconitate cis-trans isomerase PrpF family protein n=1 Tax=Rhodovulum sp. BSW8 TaxID=2259645 RepID=UPI000DE1FE98|nr:PrpF domain-containing protein [Rhodovulum sp. BSW8]RBO53875.1 PrpF family protein [Rhodovulum sp. BSW8]
MTQTAIPAAFLRGGTSKAVVLKRADLPADEAAWPALFAAIMGSPDPNKRQLNGMGGGISSLSKVCVIGPPTREDADIDYTFAQIGVTTEAVDFSGNCGNMSSAMGPFAYDEGLVAGPRDGEATVRIHNTNSGKIIRARFAVAGGRATVAGDLEIPGVPGTGAPVTLDFLDPADTCGHGALPTGKVLDRLTLADGRAVAVTMIDAAVPSVFVAAADLGADSSAHPEAIDADTALMDRLEEIRRRASVAMRLAPDMAAAAARIATPKVALVGPAAACRDLSGQVHPAESHDLQIRMISAGQAHRAVPVTGALALASAAVLPGSVVAAHCSRAADPEGLRIGTPSGIVTVGATRDPASGQILAARILRTQRRLMDGRVYAPCPAART